MANNNNAEFASPLSWPCMLCCAMASMAMFLVLRTSYTMGINSDAKGSQNYQQAFWMFVCALVLLSMTLAIIKFVE
jgi:hypothetical protein